MRLFLNLLCIGLIGAGALLPPSLMGADNGLPAKIAPVASGHKECPCHAQPKVVRPDFQQDRGSACVMCCQHPWADFASFPNNKMNVHSLSEFVFSLVPRANFFSVQLPSFYLSKVFSPSVPPPEQA